MFFQVLGLALTMYLVIEATKWVKDALALARERRGDTGLEYRAMLPGWTVGLIVGTASAAVEAVGMPQILKKADVYFAPYAWTVNQTGGADALLALLGGYSTVLFWLNTAMIAAPFVLGVLAGAAQSFRVARRDVEYERVVARIHGNELTAR